MNKRNTKSQDTIIKREREKRLNWKNKAIKRGSELRNLRKKLKKKEERIIQLKSDLRSLKKKRKSIYRMGSNLGKSRIKQQGRRAKGYHYSTSIISLVLQIRSSGQVSLRSCQNILLIIQVWLKQRFTIPSINSIRNWETQIAYYDLCKIDEGKDEYAIIIDESYWIGQQSLLLVLGVNLRTYNFEKSLSFDQVEVLTIGVNKSWKHKQIEDMIEQIEKRGYQISYAVSDKGNNIVKSLKNKGIPRISDCTHEFSKIIEKRYKSDSEFLSFCEKTILLKKRNAMGKDSIICPPKFRDRARYANLYPIAKWAKESLDLLEYIQSKSINQRSEKEQRIYEKLDYLKDYTELIKTMGLVLKSIEKIFKILKPQGFSYSSISKIEQILASPTIPVFFKKGVRAYLNEQLELLHLLDKKEERIICCSDIIESYFGKLKNQENRNPEKRINQGCLKMVNYGKTKSEAAIKDALENIKIVDIQKWKNDNKLISQKSRKWELYKNKKVG